MNDTIIRKYILQRTRYSPTYSIKDNEMKHILWGYMIIFKFLGKIILAFYYGFSVFRWSMLLQ